MTRRTVNIGLGVALLASLGLNWDMFSIHGFVFYTQGIVSIGDVVKHRLDELEMETNVLRDAFLARQ